MTRLFNDDEFTGGIMGDSPESALMAAAPASGATGIGIAPAVKKPSQRDLYRQEIDSMSSGQKFFAAMDEVGAAFRGKASPLEARIEARRKEKLLDMEELKGSITALEHGVKLTEGLEGPAREQFISSYATRLDGMEAGLGETYKQLSNRPDLLTKYKEYLPDLPEHLQVMAKTQPREFLKFAGTAEGVKALSEGLDRRELRTATKKVQTAMMGYQQFVPPDMAKEIAKDGVITASEVMQINKYMPKEAQLTDAQMQAVQRNDKTFWQGLGVLHGDQEQKLLADRAKDAGKPKVAQSELGKLRMDLDAGLITKANYDAKVAKLTKSEDGGIPKAIVDVELKLSDDYRQDTKKYAERRPLFESTTGYMAERGEKKTSAGDAALMFAYAKMRDPNDRLAVSETRDLVKLGNIFERFKVSVEGILDKGETLPDRVANQMYDEIRRSFTEINRAQAKVEKEYRQKTADYKGNPDRVVRPLSLPEEALKPGGKGDKPIDTSRPVINNPDGSISTERTITIESDGKHYLIPTIVNGKQMTEKQAVSAWRGGSNNEVGVYSTAEEADAAAKARSKRIGEVRGAEERRTIGNVTYVKKNGQWYEERK